jgi:hypothetical protein
MKLIEILGGPFDGLEIHTPNAQAIRFRGRVFLETGDLTREGLPIYWDCGRHFETLMDGVRDIEPGEI